MPSSLRQPGRTLRNLSRASGLDLLAYREAHVAELVSRALELEGVGARRQLRVWSAGCADGSEICSDGIVLAQIGILGSAVLAPGGVLLLGRGERLSDPARLGLELVTPHAYRRMA